MRWLRRSPRHVRSTMTDDRAQPPDLIASGFAGLVEGLRSDVREDIRDLRDELGKVEDRVTAQVATVEARQIEARDQLEDFASNHGELHESESTDRRKAHGDFYDYIRARELDDARRDGALGVARFGVELVSRHAGKLAQIILATAALLGIATGAVHVGVGS